MARRVPKDLTNMSLLDAVNRMLEATGEAEKSIAADVGKPLSTLQRELNPHDDGSKLGVDMLFPLMVAACGRTPETPPLPLQWLAARLGFRCVPVSRHQLDAEASPDAVRAMRVIVDFVALCEDRSASIEAVTAAYDAAVCEIEKFATRAARERGGHIALPSLRRETSWWKRMMRRLGGNW